MPSCPERGALAIVTNVGAGCGGRGHVVARFARGRTARSRTAKSCGPDAPTLASSCDEANRFTRATVTTKPGHRGEHEGNRKTIAQGMPVDPGEPVATTRCIFCTNHGCHRAPGIPRASLEGRAAPLLFGANVVAKLGRSVSRECGSVSVAVVCKPSPGILPSSFRGARSASPESIIPVLVFSETTSLPNMTAGVINSGPAPRGASRNDECCSKCRNRKCWRQPHGQRKRPGFRPAVVVDGCIEIGLTTPDCSPSPSPHRDRPARPSP